MNRLQYTFANFARAFGFGSHQKFMLSAADEMHLLEDIEAYIGSKTWQKCEGIEALSTPYWAIRQSTNQLDSLQERIVTLQDQINQSYSERAQQLGTVSEKQQELMDQRQALIEKFASLQQQTEIVIAQAREINTIRDGLNLKVKVISEEKKSSSSAELKQSELRLSEIDEEFLQLRDQRVQLAEHLESLEKEIESTDEKLNSEHKSKHNRVNTEFSNIAKLQKELAATKSQLIHHESEIMKMQKRLGHFVINHCHDKTIEPIVSMVKGYTSLAKEIRNSMQRHHKLTKSC